MESNRNTPRDEADDIGESPTLSQHLRAFSQANLAASPETIDWGVEPLDIQRVSELKNEE